MNTNYYTYKQSDYTLRDIKVSFYTKPGLPDWENVSASIRLLAEHIQVKHQGRLLLFGCEKGITATLLARMFNPYEIWATDDNYIAIQTCRATLQLNGITNFTVFGPELDLPENSFDCAVIDLPKGRSNARRWLSAAQHAIKPGGQCYLAGANNLGIQSIIRDGEALFGNLALLGYKKGNRIVRLEKLAFPPASPKWIDDPGIAPGTWIKFTASINNQVYTLSSLPGVFSHDHLDEGSRLLIEHFPDMQNQKVLDLGCGCGIIGLIAARQGAEHVDLVDVNLSAIASARKNVNEYHISRARVFPGDLFDWVKDEKYTLIVSNPPFHTGRAVDTLAAETFIKQTPGQLIVDGCLLIVANKFIRYDRLMKQSFGRVDIIAETSKYHLIRATTPSISP